MWWLEIHSKNYFLNVTDNWLQYYVTHSMHKKIKNKMTIIIRRQNSLFVGEGF